MTVSLFFIRFNNNSICTPTNTIWMLIVRHFFFYRKLMELIHSENVKSDRKEKDCLLMCSICTNYESIWVYAIFRESIPLMGKNCSFFFHPTNSMASQISHRVHVDLLQCTDSAHWRYHHHFSLLLLCNYTVPYGTKKVYCCISNDRKKLRLIIFLWIRCLVAMI